MGFTKKKPKPFNAMSKVLCTGVQSRRFMVMSSLVLVLLGCLALYSAMQNEEWTKDEPSQRKVFFLAFLLFITSIGLCYYALTGDLEEDKEMMESGRLTSVIFGDYNSFKTSSALTSSGQKTKKKTTENDLLKLLEPRDPKANLTTRNQGRLESSQRKERYSKGRKNITTPVISNAGEERTSTNQSSSIQVTDDSYQVSHKQIRQKSLIVDLMPLLPLQLCEKELANLQSSSATSGSNQSNLVSNSSDRIQSQSRASLPRDVSSALAPVHKNADAG